MKDLLESELIYFLENNDWFDINVKEQARAIFTTICVVWDINADSGDCDTMVEHLYYVAGLDKDDLITYEDYYDYMVELIV